MIEVAGVNGNMKQFETQHYFFYYNPGTKAEADIERIAACQEDCFLHICNTLGLSTDFRITYFLCDSPEEVGRIYGDNDPCNGFAAPPDRIYAVYNEEIQCIGFHEDAHILSYRINRPDCPAIREGLAMYFDRKWWGIQNLDWTGYYLKTGRFLPVDALLDKDFFCSQDCHLTYPVMGAFTDWLISRWGMERYLQIYRQNNIPAAMVQVYGMTPAELNQAFADYVGLFRIDGALEDRMEQLLVG